MTEVNDGWGWWLDGGWRIQNGTSWTIIPKLEPSPPDGCLRITAWRIEGIAIAGDAVATEGNYVSLLLSDCDIDSKTPADVDQPRIPLNLVLAGSTVAPLIATLAMASRDTELLELLPQLWRIPAPGEHVGRRTQVDWAVPNGLSGIVTVDDLPLLSSGQCRLLITEPEFSIVGDFRGGMWCSVTALRPWWVEGSAGPVQLEEVNLVMESADWPLATLLHAAGQPALADMQRVFPNRRGSAEPNEVDVLERVLNAIDDTYEQGLVSERSGTGQEPERDNTPSTDTSVDDDGAEHVIGLAALVDPVMKLNHDTPNPRRREYLLARIEIIAMEIGAVDDRFNLFQALLSPDLFSTSFGSPLPPDFSTLKLPGIEDPPQVAGPYLEVEQRAHSLDAAMRDLRGEILELRREWLTSALLKVEPALEYRTTTEARLRARGLPSRP